jgi:hypothetical protein
MQEFTVTKFRWEKFPIQMDTFSLVVEQNDSSDVAEKSKLIEHLLELFPYTTTIFIQSEDELLHVEQRKNVNVVIDATKFKTKDWVFCGIIDKIKHKIIFTDTIKNLPKTIITNANIILTKDLTSYLTMIYTGVDCNHLMKGNDIIHVVDRLKSVTTFNFMIKPNKPKN